RGHGRGAWQYHGHTDTARAAGWVLAALEIRIAIVDGEHAMTACACENVRRSGKVLDDRAAADIDNGLRQVDGSKVDAAGPDGVLPERDGAGRGRRRSDSQTAAGRIRYLRGERIRHAGRQ